MSALYVWGVLATLAAMVDATATVLSLDALRAAVRDLEDQTLAFEEAPDLGAREAIVSTLDAMRDLVKRIQHCDASIVQRVSKVIGKDEIVVGAGAVAEKKWNSARKTWNHAAMKPVVAEKVMQSHIDPETGAMDAPVSQLILEALECASISGWKSTKCKPLGINVDHYCEKGDGKYNLVIRKSGGAGTPGSDEESDDDG